MTNCTYFTICSLWRVSMVHELTYISLSLSELRKILEERKVTAASARAASRSSRLESWNERTHAASSANVGLLEGTLCKQLCANASRAFCVPSADSMPAGVGSGARILYKMLRVVSFR